MARNKKISNKQAEDYFRKNPYAFGSKENDEIINYCRNRIAELYTQGTYYQKIIDILSSPTN